jgi:type VII secretion-associated serine protease mycosin
MRKSSKAVVSPARTVARALATGAVLLAVGAAAAAPAAAQSIRAQQWHISAMRLDDAWKLSKGQGVTVAVIDSGVSPSASGLTGKVLEGKDFSPRPGTAHDPISPHGTGVASLIASSGEGPSGPIGVAPEAKVLPLRVDGDVSGVTEAQQSTQLLDEWSKAIRYAADSSARIINLSLAQTDNGPNLSSAVSYAQSKGKLIVAGVGNSRDYGNPVEYPAALPGVVGVSSFDEQGHSTKFAERGPQVALAAAGVDMFHACSGGTGFCKTSGTSDSTAVVSGSAALVWAKHPDWTADQVIRVLINTAGHPTNAKRDDVLGYGAVRPRVALQTPGDPGPADVNPLVPASAASTGSPTTAPSASATPPSASASGSPLAADASSSGGGGGNNGLWIGVGAAVVVVAAVLGFVAVRRRGQRV